MTVEDREGGGRCVLLMFQLKGALLAGGVWSAEAASVPAAVLRARGALCPAPMFGVVEPSRIETVEESLGRLGVYDRLALVVARERRGDEPRWLLYEEVLRAADLPRGQVVFVGADLDGEVRPAWDAGLCAVWLDRLGIGEARDLPLHRIGGLEDLVPLLRGWIHSDRDRHRDALVDRIEAAFDGASPPPAGHRSLLEAEAWDGYEQANRSGEHLGRWQDLPEELLHRCSNALTYLDGHGFRYYLPAIMTARLRPGLLPHRGEPMICDSLDFALLPDRGDAGARRHALEQLGRLSPEQRRVVADYVVLTHDESLARDRWRRAAAVEGARWFDVWWPPEAGAQ